MSKLRAFLLGVAEFRDDMTTGFEDYELLVAYDWGREWAHRLTFRRWNGPWYKTNKASIGEILQEILK